MWDRLAEAPDSLNSPIIEVEKHRPRDPRWALSLENQIVLTLMWLREYPKFKTLASEFGTTTVQVFRTIEKILPILYKVLVPAYIIWPQRQYLRALRGVFPDFPDTIGLADCTPVWIRRPMHGDIQRAYIRRDRGKIHFINWFVVVDAYLNFIFGRSGFRGHLTDATVYRYCGMPGLQRGNILVDRGFPNVNPLLAPVRDGQGVARNIQLLANR